MTTQTMREKIAWEICKAGWLSATPPAPEPVMRNAFAMHNASYLAQADAALQALREPTEEMMRAVEPEELSTICTPSVADGWRKEYRRIFTTAIDAALQEKAS